MALLDRWNSASVQLEAKQLQKIIAIAGEGRLSDGNVASEEFRALLAHLPSAHLERFTNEALAGKFEGNGFALQDTLMRSDDGWATRPADTAAFRGRSASTDCGPPIRAANYRKGLMRAGKLLEESSSILIVVGREDTGDLETQIRGSRRALRLLQVKESVDTPVTARKIGQILIPREYTRVDGIIDVVFSASEEERLTGEVEDEDDQGSTAVQDGKKFVPVSFHEQCVERIQKTLRMSLVKQTRSTYASPDGQTAVVCSISRRHETSNGGCYWFAYHPSHSDFLRQHSTRFVALGCGSPDRVVLIPFDHFQPWLASMNVTRKEDRMYWHVKILAPGSELRLYRKGGHSNTDLKPYLIS